MSLPFPGGRRFSCTQHIYLEFHQTKLKLCCLLVPGKIDNTIQVRSTGKKNRMVYAQGIIDDLDIRNQSNMEYLIKRSFLDCSWTPCKQYIEQVKTSFKGISEAKMTYKKYPAW